MHVTLMHNPGAGNGHPSREALEAAFRRAGHCVSYQSTKVDGYEAALVAPGDLVVAAGGDGTVEKVARRMVGRDVPVAILPLGTANNIATSLGVAGAWQDLVAGWADGRPARVDVGRIRTPWGEGHFLEGAGIGLLADAIVQADAREDELERGSTRQQLSAAFHLMGGLVPDAPAHPVSIRLDGVDHSGDYLLVEVLNTGRIGPGLPLGRGADPGDGLLELALAGPGHRDALARYFAENEPADDQAPPVTILRGRVVEIAWSGARLHVDDAIWPEADEDPAAEPSAVDGARLVVRSRPGALTFLLPPD